GLVAFLASVCLLLTQSRAGLVSFMIELWACAWFLKRRAMSVIAGAITIMLIVLGVSLLHVVSGPDGTISFTPRETVSIKTSTESFVHRIDIWSFMVGRIAEHPLV